MLHTSIRYRLMILMICLTTLPVLIVTWIATNNTRNSVEKEIIEANASRMIWAEQYLDELVQQIDVLFYSLQINQDLMDGLKTLESQNEGSQFRTQRYIQETLTTAFYANSRKVNELSLYTHQNQRVYAVNFTTSGLIYSLDIRKGLWSRMQHDPVSLYFKQSGNHIYAFHSVNQFENRSLLGGLSVRINEKVWKQLGDILRSEPDSPVFLLNDEDELLSGSSATEEYDELLKLYSEGLQDRSSEVRITEKYILFSQKVDDGALTLLKAVPLTSVTESANDTVKAGFLAGFLFAALSILVSIVVSLRISRPIVSLARTMRMTPIHQFEMKSVQSRDEIGLLEHGYNSMMLRIKELIENEYQREIEVKNAQLMALQAQINPHFLNNTLNLIGGMALSKGVPEIYKITKGIGDLLRYSISSGEELAALEDELKHVRNYLFIQEQRFMGRCTVQISADEPVPRILLPRFTLQPLVENAFEHGLQPKEGAWQIEIRIKSIGSRIGIMIKDNGIGMELVPLYTLRNELLEGIPSKIVKKDDQNHKPRKQKGIGLMNVDSRLKLHYGGSCLQIFSKPGRGTLIVVKLPLHREGADHE
ncbi:sensor histidine kinase [Cohnella sp.]|uniref:sensor histidine kinase n=1 Tax=Cohnella sp. TaxID=1883426 RepID=UPI0035694D9B